MQAKSSKNRQSVGRSTGSTARLARFVVVVLSLLSTCLLNIETASASATLPITGRILDTTSAPMSGWTIYVYTADSSASSTLTTDSSGNFSGYVPGESPAGTPDVISLHPNVSFPTVGSSSFNWNPADSVLNMTVPKIVQFTAHFTSGGTPIEGASVDSFSCPGSAGSWANSDPFAIVPGQTITIAQQYNSSSNSDSSGNAPIAGWPKSNLVLCGYAPLHGINAPAIVTTNLTTSTSVVNFSVIDTSKPLSGRILDTTSAPMSGWTIYVYTADSSASSTLTTDSSGNFSGYVPGESPAGTPDVISLHPNVSFPTVGSSSFNWNPADSVLNMTVPKIVNQQFHVTNNGLPMGGVQVESVCTASWLYSNPYAVVPGQTITFGQQYNASSLTDLNGNVTVQGFPITGARICADLSGAGVSIIQPTTLDISSDTLVDTIAATLDIPTLPIGARLNDLQAPVTVVTSSSSVATASATVGSTSAALTAPAGALPAGTTLNLFPLSTSYPSSSVLPQGSTFVAGFAVNWTTPGGQSPNSSAPLSVVLTDSSIHVGDVVYMVVNGQTQIVGTATVAGSVSVTFQEDPIFLLGSPPAAVVTSGDAPNSQVASIPAGVTSATFSGSQVANATLGFTSSSSAATASVVPVANPTDASLTPFTTAGGFAIVDIEVSGITGPVTVCLDGGATDHLFHYTAGVWVDITTSHANGQVCGVTSSFSPFGAGIPHAITPVDNTAKPTAPSNVTASLSNGTALVTFVPGSSGSLPTYNEIDLYVNGELFGNVCNVTGATSCKVANLGPNAKFSFVVTAFNAKGSAPSAPSNIVSYTSPTTVPPAPTTTTTTPSKPVKRTITCVKGKVTKKVTAIKPVCPLGFKQK